MIARLTALYLAIFAVVLLAISFAAYAFVGSQYHALLLPALGTPEGAHAYALAMRKVAFTIAAFDVPLLLLVGAASWLLASLSLSPLLRARERERAFVADAAHELRSPLTTIATVAQATRADDPPEQLRDALALIASTALDAGALIGDLLTLARSPRPELLATERVDLADIARTCANEFRARADAASIALEVAVQRAVVAGDQRRLRELTRNLLENALRHARSRIVLTCRRDGALAMLCVQDDGSGVPAEHRERVFARAFRDERSSGSGLGLALAQWVAQAHGGTIGLANTNECGALFRVELPALE